MYHSCVLLLLLLSLVLVASVYSTDTPFDCISCFQVRVGKAERLYGPVATELDNPFFSITRDDGYLLGYSSNAAGKLIFKEDLEQAVQDPLVVLEEGDAGAYDSCGSWLNSAIIDGDTIRGWYHAEYDCNYDIGQTYKSIGYCESHDGGLTYEKKGYPNNQVITGSLPPTAGQTIGTGDHSVLLGNDGYYYIFYIDWNDYGHCVARAPVSSGGVPGSWTKYYNGEWSSPGIGGNCSGIWQLVGATVYNHESGNLVSVGNGNGISLAFGKSAISFKQLNVPIVFAEGSQWVRTTSSTELLSYPALVPMGGGSDPLDNSFWLYYTYVEPGKYFTDRYLVRRQVDIFTPNEAMDISAQAGVELSRYTSGPKTWVTTTAPIFDNFSYDTSLGYILTAEYDSTVPLYDCYIESWDDHMLNINKCDTTAGITFLRLMGWVYANRQPYTSPIYRCWNVDTLKHSVSNSIDCEGNGYMEFILGWTLDQ